MCIRDSAWIVLRGRPHLWPAGAWGNFSRQWHRAGPAADLGIALAAFGLYAAVSRLVLSASPLLIDEIIQVYQARTFAGGALWRVAPAHPEFTGAMHLIDWGGKVYGQFPAGGPAMLALGTLAHAEWLVGPLFAAIGLFAFARVLRRIEGREGTALAALLLYGLAPFTIFLSASMMNHVTTVTWLLLGPWALTVATATNVARVGAAFAVGLSFAADEGSLPGIVPPQCWQSSPLAGDTRKVGCTESENLPIGVAMVDVPVALSVPLPPASNVNV